MKPLEYEKLKKLLDDDGFTIERMEEVGSAIKEIMEHKRIRGKFSGVHPDLRKEGIVGVEVGEEGLHLLREGAGQC